MQLTEDQFDALEAWVEAKAEKAAAGHHASDWEYMQEDNARGRFRQAVGLPEYRQ